MHFVDYHAIRERDHTISNPITAEKLDLMAEYCRVGDGKSMLDIGSGSSLHHTRSSLYPRPFIHHHQNGGRPMEHDAVINKRKDGAHNEEIALRFLLDLGYTLVKRNFRFGRMGEIDLIMRDKGFYVFVEVKSRRSHGFGLPEEAVTPSKRRQIKKVAGGFIYINGLVQYEARFDVVAIDYVTGVNGEPEIRHYVNAFY